MSTSINTSMSKNTNLTTNTLPNFSPVASVIKKIENTQAIIPTSAFTPVNNLPSEIKDPIKITTSKKWVLPPRPKPGRKPLPSDDINIPEKEGENKKDKENEEEKEKEINNIHHYGETFNEKASFSNSNERNHSISNNILNNSNIISSPNINSLSPKTSSSCIPTPSPTPDSLSPKMDLQNSLDLTKRRPVAKICSKSSNSSKKKNNLSPDSNPNFNSNNNRMIEIDCSIIHNPLKKEILKINEENYYLKLEVIRLVSNLKGLRDEIQPIVEKRKSLKSNRSSPSPSPSALSSSSSSMTIKPTTNSTANKNSNKSKLNIENQQNKSFLQSKKIDQPLNSIESFESRISPNSETSIDTLQQSKPQSKKRCHDDDINDLIVSLIDLSHSQTSVELQSNENKIINQNIKKETNEITNITINENKNQINFNANTNKENNNMNINNIKDVNDNNYTINNHESSLLESKTNSAKDNKIKPSIESPLFQNYIHVSDPFMETTKSFERNLLYDEDDLLSTVSTTPSTMFSLSLSQTNETLDSMNINNNNSNNINMMENINELPPFDLLDLPDDDALINGKIDVKLNYEVPMIAPSVMKSNKHISILDTFNAINSNFADEFMDDDDDDDIGSLELLNFTNNKLSSSIQITSNNNENNDIVDFTMADDVDLEFENFINGKDI
jgi:hypothetical protein